MFSSLKFWIDLKLAFVIIICKEKNSNPTGERSHCRDPSLYLCSLHGRLKKKEYEEICNNEFFLILYTLENEFQHLPLNSEFVYIRTLIIFFLEPLFWVECFKKKKKIIFFFFWIKIFLIGHITNLHSCSLGDFLNEKRRTNSV